MSQQITDFIAKVDQVLAKEAATAAENSQLKSQLADAQNQLSALQAQLANGALSADDEAAVAAESAKIDAALATPAA